MGQLCFDYFRSLRQNVITVIDIIDDESFNLRSL